MAKYYEIVISICRILIIISPVVGLDYDKSEDDWLVYGTNMFAALTILVKDCLMLWNIGKAYLESTSAVIEMIAVTVLIAIDIDTIVQHDNRLFILWSTLCVIFTINLIDRKSVV